MFHSCYKTIEGLMAFELHERATLRKALTKHYRNRNSSSKSLRSGIHIVVQSGTAVKSNTFSLTGIFRRSARHLKPYFFARDMALKILSLTLSLVFRAKTQVISHNYLFAFYFYKTSCSHIFLIWKRS